MIKRDLNEETIYIKILRARDSILSFFKPILNNHDITEQQWRILSTLKSSGLITFNELAKATLILRPSLTGILNRLEKRGLVQRLKTQGDQRKVSLRLTHAGETICNELQDQVNEQYAVIAQLFRGNEFEKLRNGLDKLNELADEYNEQSDFI